MKLAEALQERADLNRKISDLRNRLENVVLVQEGEEPVEDPKWLLIELDTALFRLEYLMAAINHSNDSIMAGELTLTQLIAKKDALNIRLSTYKDLVREAGMNTSRVRGTEIRVKAVVKASELQKEVDRMSKEIRQLDNLLQETNWTKDLIE